MVKVEQYVVFVNTITINKYIITINSNDNQVIGHVCILTTKIVKLILINKQQLSQ